MRERYWPGTRLRPDRQRERRGNRTRRRDLSGGMARDAVPGRRVVPVMTPLAVARDGLLQVSMPGARTVARGAGDGCVARMLEPRRVAPLARRRGGDIQRRAFIASPSPPPGRRWQYRPACLTSASP